MGASYSSHTRNFDFVKGEGRRRRVEKSALNRLVSNSRPYARKVI